MQDRHFRVSTPSYIDIPRKIWARNPRGRLLACTDHPHLGNPAGTPNPAEGSGHRLHPRRRTRQPRAVPATDHDPRPHRRHRARVGSGLRPALGNREHLRRTENPPTRPPSRPAIEVPRAGQARDLGTPVLPLRHPHADGRRRTRRPARTHPSLVRRRPTNHPKITVAQRFFLLITTIRSPVCGRMPPQHCSAESTPHAGSAPTRAWSNAKFSNGRPNAATTSTIRNPRSRQNAQSSSTN